MPGDAVGVVDLALITAALVGAVWLCLHLDELWQRGRALARRTGLMARLPPIPQGMPIERIAADLRRIRPQARALTPGTPMARRLAIVAAYDEVLLDACHALDVPTELGRIQDPLERESERLRTEAALERAGVDLG